MDRGACLATVHGVLKSWTQRSNQHYKEKEECVQISNNHTKKHRVSHHLKLSVLKPQSFILMEQGAAWPSWLHWYSSVQLHVFYPSLDEY